MNGEMNLQHFPIPDPMFSTSSGPVLADTRAECRGAFNQIPASAVGLLIGILHTQPLKFRGIIL
jgi:hypothetical protein